MPTELRNVDFISSSGCNFATHLPENFCIKIIIKFGISCNGSDMMQN